MKKLQSWVDLWATDSSLPRQFFVEQMKAMLTEVLMEIEVKAAKNTLATGTTQGWHTLALQQVLKEIEELK